MAGSSPEHKERPTGHPRRVVRRLPKTVRWHRAKIAITITLHAPRINSANSGPFLFAFSQSLVEAIGPAVGLERLMKEVRRDETHSFNVGGRARSSGKSDGYGRAEQPYT